MTRNFRERRVYIFSDDGVAIWSWRKTDDAIFRLCRCRKYVCITPQCCTVAIYPYRFSHPRYFGGLYRMFHSFQMDHDKIAPGKVKYGWLGIIIYIEASSTGILQNKTLQFLSGSVLALLGGWVIEISDSRSCSGYPTAVLQVDA